MASISIININKPYILAGILFLSALAMMLLALAVSAAHIMAMDPLFPWLVATSMLLLFAVSCSLLSLRADTFAKYWGLSVYSYVGLAFMNGTAARFVSGIPIAEAGTYKWIFIVVTIGFLVFLSLVNAVRGIVQFAEREEWNQPRQRK